MNIGQSRFFGYSSGFSSSESDVDAPNQFAAQPGSDMEFDEEDIDSNISGAASDEGEHTTPVQIRKRGRAEEEVTSPTKKVEAAVGVIRSADPALPLNSPQKKTVRQAISAAREAPDTPNGKKQARLACQIADAGLSVITGEAPQNPDSPRYHKTVVRNLRGWPVGVIGDAAQIANGALHTERRRRIGPFLNLGHTAAINVHDEKVSGCHWLHPQDESRRRLTVTCSNPETAVYCGFISSDKGPKFSTFFPDSIRSEHELLRFIGEAAILHTCENMQIREKDGVHFMCYIRTNELEIRSAFPFFIFQNWEPNRTYEIARGCTLSSDDVITAYKAIKNNIPSPVLMNIDGYVIIDIAQGIPTKNQIDKGIVFVIPIRELRGM